MIFYRTFGDYLNLFEVSCECIMDTENTNSHEQLCATALTEVNSWVDGCPG